MKPQTVKKLLKPLTQKEMASFELFLSIIKKVKL
jgi:hypothetical protein